MQGRPPSIKVGITTLQPDTMELPDVIDNIQEDTWMVSGQYIYVLPNGLTQGTIQYGGNLDLLTVCKCVSMYMYVHVCMHTLCLSVIF